jgi:tRNA(fMet)-specific endonuclease VapC
VETRVGTPGNVALVDALQFEVLEFDQEDAREAGAIRALLATRATPIEPYDVLIAGQAKARGLTLVTRNTNEFARVSGLRLQNWDRQSLEKGTKRKGR